MLAEMPAGLMAEWENFFKIEPQGALVDELRVGQICAVLANIHSDKSKRFSAYDFLTTVDYKKPQQSQNDMLNVLMGVMGGSKN